MNAETFWMQVRLFNESTLPLQVVLIIAALTLTYMVFFKPGTRTDAWMKAFFALAFAWNGVAFFLVFARNPISTFLGAPLFILLAVLFLMDLISKRTEFKLPRDRWKQVLTIAWVVLVFLYPLCGFPAGHLYPRMLTPVMPCPLTVFALAMIVAAAPNVDKKIYILLLPWALVSLPKCLGALDCHEDCILFAAGIYGLIFLIRDWKGISAPQPATF